jgi:hypothetical protein
MSKQKMVYKIIFEQQDKVYEIYAKHISEGALMGFIEIEELIFSDPDELAIIDPAEEQLKIEFAGVKRSYIPLHGILRIDEMPSEQSTKVKITDSTSIGAGNIKHFPGSFTPKED